MSLFRRGIDTKLFSISYHLSATKDSNMFYYEPDCKVLTVVGEKLGIFFKEKF